MLFGHVHGRTDVLGEVPGCVEDRMADGVDVFRLSTRKNDPVFEVKIWLLMSDGSVKDSDVIFSILWMDSLKEILVRWHSSFRIEAQ